MAYTYFLLKELRCLTTLENTLFFFSTALFQLKKEDRQGRQPLPVFLVRSFSPVGEDELVGTVAAAAGIFDLVVVIDGGG